jgi:hypothetical protein
LLGELALPYSANPYLPGFGAPTRVAGAALPGAGNYDVVFDSPTPSGAGPFTFRFWIGDTTPPRIRFVRYASGFVFVRITDAGAGVDPSTVAARVDARLYPQTFRGSVLRIRTGALPRGLHRLLIEAADFQETKNMEDVARILPNTRVYRASFRVR